MKRLAALISLVFLLAPLAAQAANTTWNPSDKGPQQSLSNLNLTVTQSGGTGTSNISRTIDGKTSGKYHFEITSTVHSSDYGYVGVSLAGATSKTGMAVQGNNGVAWVNNSSVNSNAADAFSNDGDVVAVEVDLDAKIIRFDVRKAGVWSGWSANFDISSIETGPLLPVAWGDGSGNQYVANFGDSAWLVTPTAGFGAWTNGGATYQGTASVTLGTATSPFFPSVPVGEAYTNRRVLVGMDFTYSPYYGGITAVKINGTSVGSNFIIDDSASSWLGTIVWAWADVPTGTTASVDITTPGSVSGSGQQTVSVYTFDNTLAASAPTHYKVIGSSGTSASNSIATGAGGFLISAMHLYALTSQASITLSASDEGMSTNYTYHGSQATQGIASKASGTSVSGANSATWSWASGAPSFNSMLYWGPAATPARKMRLFEGFKIKLISGKMILYQQ